MKRLCCILIFNSALVLFTFLRQLPFFNYSIKERLSQSVVNTFTKLLKTRIRICGLPPAMVCADTI